MDNHGKQIPMCQCHIHVRFQSILSVSVWGGKSKGDLQEPGVFPSDMSKHIKMSPSASCNHGLSFGTTPCFTSKCVHRKQRYLRSRVSPHSFLLKSVMMAPCPFFPSKISKTSIRRTKVVNCRTAPHDMHFWGSMSGSDVPGGREQEAAHSTDKGPSTQGEGLVQDSSSVFLSRLLPIYNFISK